MIDKTIGTYVYFYIYALTFFYLWKQKKKYVGQYVDIMLHQYAHCVQFTVGHNNIGKL